LERLDADSRVAVVFSHLACGGEFLVRLPLEAAVAPATQVKRREADVKREELRVLLIDDNRDVAGSLAMPMESLGAKVRAAFDGASGVEAAAEFRRQVAFVDIRMPGMDGHETARRMRGRFGDRTPMLVALTGLGQDKDGEQALAAGFDVHVTKPASAEALENCCLRSRRREHDSFRSKPSVQGSGRVVPAGGVLMNRKLFARQTDPWFPF
jgi:CheY-like chemotaxis protein